MAAAAHQIKRVVFDLTAPDRAAFDRLSHHIRVHFGGILPALHAALDRADHTGGMVRIDRIEIDLGRLDGRLPSDDVLGRRLADGLSAALNKALIGTSRGSSPPLDDIAELAQFLETGVLPWPRPGRALAAMMAASAAWDEAMIVRLAAHLRPILARGLAALRLVRQLPAALIHRLVLAMVELPVPTVPEITTDPANSLRSDPLAAPPAHIASELAAGIRILARASGAPAQHQARAILDRLSGLTEVPPSSPVAPTTPPIDELKPEVTITEPTDQPAAIPVHAAGAVLLHPFLATFFDRLGLLSKPGHFRDADARARAVLLAYHAATGEEETFEPDTILFKLLTGMPLAEPIPRAITPSEVEREVTDGFLSAIIEHWNRLGSTSPAGLQEGFLTRPGRLVRQPSGWRLTVEPRGIDLLLDDLPWTISHVRTPFMADMLTVDWR